jgi:hypothetical protein
LFDLWVHIACYFGPLFSFRFAFYLSWFWVFLWFWIFICLISLFGFDQNHL